MEDKSEFYKIRREGVCFINQVVWTGLAKFVHGGAGDSFRSSIDSNLLYTHSFRKERKQLRENGRRVCMSRESLSFRCSDFGTERSCFDEADRQLLLRYHVLVSFLIVIFPLRICYKEDCYL